MDKPPERLSIRDAAFAATDRTVTGGVFPEISTEQINAHRTRKAARALGVKSLNESLGEQPVLFNFQMLHSLMEVLGYPSMSPREIWLKFREIDAKLIDNDGQPILAVTDAKYYEVPAIPNDFTMGQRQQLHRRNIDLKEFDKEALIVANLSQIAELEERSKQYGWIKTVKRVASDIYEVYGPAIADERNSPSAER